MNRHPPVPLSWRLAVIVVLGNLMLAVAFAVDLWGPVAESAAAVPMAYQPPAPLRREVPKELLFEEVSCAECHADMEPPEKPAMRTTETHANIVLDHATNVYCANCHHPDPKNYDVFVDHLGGAVPLAKTEQLCGKCHGQRLVDWQHGSHGKTLGFWDSAYGDQQVVTCIECHDPHRPAYPKLEPAPGPGYAPETSHD